MSLSAKAAKYRSRMLANAKSLQALMRAGADSARIRNLTKSLQFLAENGQTADVDEIAKVTQTTYPHLMPKEELTEFMMQSRLKASDLKGVFELCRDVLAAGQRPTEWMCRYVIQGAGRAGRSTDASKFLDNMDTVWGLEVDEYTVAILIKALLEAGDEMGAVDLAMAKWGLANLPPHQEVFRDVILANGMAFGSKEALEVGRFMEELGVGVDPQCAEALLVVCASDGDVDGAMGLWRRMQATGLQATDKAAGAYAETLAGAGVPVKEIAEEILQYQKEQQRDKSMHTGDVVAGIARAILATENDPDRALEVLRVALDVDPTDAALTAAVAAYGLANKFDAAERVLQFRASDEVRRALITAYGQSNNVERALQLAEGPARLPMPTVGALMRAVGGLGADAEDRAWRCVARPPVLRGCQMGLRGLLLGRARRGHIDAAANAAKTMMVENDTTPSPRLITASVMSCDEPLVLLSTLRDKGVTLTARPFNAILSAATTDAEADRIVEQMTTFEIVSDAETFQVVIERHLQHDDVESALEALDEMERDEDQHEFMEAEPYTALMDFHAVRGEVEACWNLVVRMQQFGVVPNPGVYRALARSLFEAETPFSAQHAQELFLASSQKESVPLDAEMLFAELRSILPDEAGDDYEEAGDDYDAAQEFSLETAEEGASASETFAFESEAVQPLSSLER